MRCVEFSGVESNDQCNTPLSLARAQNMAHESLPAFMIIFTLTVTTDRMDDLVGSKQSHGKAFMRNEVEHHLMLL